MMTQDNVYRWSFIERVSIAVLNFGGNIVLTRMLSTDDFGLLAMIAIFTSMAYNLSNCGLSDGLIHKLKPTAVDYSTVFVFNSLLGLVLGGTAIAFARHIADFFGHEELVWVMRIYGVCFFFQTMGFVQETRLKKMLEMKKLCLARVGATATALALGITLAAFGCGYWALVSTQIILSFFTFVFIVGVARWFPRVAFSVKSFREFFGYGVHLMLTYVINNVAQNVNTFVLGRCYSSAQTGLYYEGAKLANVPFSITESSINAPFFVVASNESDTARQRASILNMMATIVALNGAIALALALVAREAIVFLYGSKWAGAAPVMTVLALYGCVMCVKYFYQTIFKVYGRTRMVRNLTLCELLVQLSILVVFYRQGLVAIALTQLAAISVIVVVYVLITARMMSMTGRELIRGLIRPLLFPVLAFAAGVAVKLALGGVGVFWECLAVLMAFGLVMSVGHVRRRRLMSRQK